MMFCLAWKTILRPFLRKKRTIPSLAQEADDLILSCKLVSPLRTDTTLVFHYTLQYTDIALCCTFHDES